MNRITSYITRAAFTALLITPAISATPAHADETAPPDTQPVLAPTSPYAPGWGRKGFSIALAFASDNIGAEDPGPEGGEGQLFVDENGGGVLFRTAYAFTPSVALGFSLAGAPHSTTIAGQEVVHGTAAFDLRYTFLPRERARPYIEGGLGGSTLALDLEGFDVEVRGAMALLGAGVGYNLTRHLLLNAGARLEFINWTEVSVTRDEDGATVTLEDPVEDDGGAVKLLLGAGWAF